MVMLCSDRHFFWLRSVRPDNNDGYSGPSDHICDAVVSPSLSFQRNTGPFDNHDYGDPSEHICDGVFGPSRFLELCALIIMSASVVLRTTILMFQTVTFFFPLYCSPS